MVFNKVCTSQARSLLIDSSNKANCNDNQYFLWYLLLLPLLIPRLSMSKTRAALCTFVWVGTQALWLSEAYKLEFLGQNVFVALWIRGLIYVIGNCWIVTKIMDSYQVDERRVNDTKSDVRN